MGDLIGKYLLKEEIEVDKEVESMVYEEIDNIEFEVSKLVNKMVKKAIASISKKTGMKRNDVKQLFIEIGESSDIVDFI